MVRGRGFKNQISVSRSWRNSIVMLLRLRSRVKYFSLNMTDTDTLKNLDRPDRHNRYLEKTMNVSLNG